MLILGILLILLTCVVAIAIGAKANSGIRNFDEANHENFLGADQEIRSEMKQIDVPSSDLNT